MNIKKAKDEIKAIKKHDEFVEGQGSRIRG